MVLPILESLVRLASENYISRSDTLQKSSLKSAIILSPEPIVPFATGGMGNFPFFWHNEQQQFNYDTYSWINTNLQNGNLPLEQQLGSLFTNLFIEAISCVYFSLSTADASFLTAQNKQLTSLQQQMVNLWNASFTPTYNGFDQVIGEICLRWASPPTTEDRLLSSPNVLVVLNKVPFNGQPLIPLLVNYITTLNMIEPITSRVSKNNGNLEEVKVALQHPTLQNGGILATDCLIYPAYRVVNSVQDIINGLDGSNEFDLQMTIRGDGSEQVTVTSTSFQPFSASLEEIIKLVVEGMEGKEDNLLLTVQDTLEVSMTFKGITEVMFSPFPYNAQQDNCWYWVDPIIEAIRNGTSDVTGFKFRPKPTIDFSQKGPFAFLTAVVISNFPEVRLNLNHPNQEHIANTLEKAPLASLTLLGRSFTTLCSAAPDKGDGSNGILISLSPPPQSTYSITSRAWIHGAIPCFPASTITI